MDIRPPKRALKFLRWFCREDYVDEIEGDLLEIFKQQCKQSPSKAKWKFTWSVIKYFRPEFIKSFRSNQRLNPTIMFRHNLLITYRNFLRYKSSFFINLIGLSTGLACTLLIYLWVYDEVRMDKFHSNDEHLYQVLENVDQGGGMITRYTTSGPTAQALQDEMPEVEYAVTSFLDYIRTNTLTVDDNDISARCLYASDRFFDMFSYPLVQGNKDQVLKDKKSMVISESMAISLFGSTENVVGKMVEWQHENQYQVTGVFRDLTSQSSPQFDFVLTFQEFWDNNEWVRNWYNTAAQTHVILKEGTNIAQFNEKIKDLVRTKTEGNANHRTPFLAKYSDRYLYNKYENGHQAGGRIEYVKMFSIIAIFILIIACINFMNLSTARASRRLKEVGMKKAVGARQGTLVVQYFGESILMSLFALAVALLLVALLLPQFNIITEKQLTLNLDANFLLYLVGIVLFTGIISGSYPALYLSKFNPAAILKGKVENHTGEAWARKGLVVFQFTLSIILIVSVWVVYAQIEFVQHENLGYNRDNIILVGGHGLNTEKQETFLHEVKGLPGIVDASSIGHDMTGHNGGTYGIVWPGKDPDDRTEFERVSANYGIIELLGIEMKEGRSFSKDHGLDTGKIIFNEAAIAFMGLEDPLGMHVTLWGNDMEIIGVTKDFHFDSFREKVKPLFFYAQPENTGTIMVKIEAGKEQPTLAQLQNFYQQFNPGFPFSYKFLDDDYQKLYTSEQRVAILSRYFAGLAVLISCLGLFGLVSFTVERRTKEIGIRKILGSGEVSIIYLLTNDFTKMVMTAIIVALPVSYFLTASWLDTFAFKIDLQWWFFVAAGMAALLIAWLTVSIQTFRAARINPVNCIRNE